MVSSVINHISHSPIQSMIHVLESLFELSAEVINAVGGLVLLMSTLTAILHSLQSFLYDNCNDNVLSNSFVKKLLKFEDNHSPPKFWFGKGTCTIDNIRLRLGSGITFALELLVAADVIDTLTKPVNLYQMETLQKIAVVVAIRTALSYFLNKEIEELEHKVSKEKLH